MAVIPSLKIKSGMFVMRIYRSKLMLKVITDFDLNQSHISKTIRPASTCVSSRILFPVLFLLFFNSTASYAKAQEIHNENDFLHISATGGLEEYFFYQENSPYNESFSEIETDVKPITLYYFKVNGSVPYFFFNTLYKYSVSRNGSISDDEKKFIKEKVDNPKIQYLIDVSSGLLGLEMDYLYQNFNNGVYSYYRSGLIPDDATVLISKDRNIYSGKDYVSITKKQFDVKYHYKWNELPMYGGLTQSETGEDLFIGYRYVKSQSPAIIYTTDFDNGILVGESLPQIVDTYYHMIGIGINNNSKPLDKGFNLLLGGVLYLGYSYMYCNLNDYWFLPSSFDANYDPASDRNTKIHMIPINLSTNVNLVYCLTNKFVTTSITLEWIIDLYYQFGHYTDTDDIYETGNAPCEIFQSLRLTFRTEF